MEGEVLALVYKRRVILIKSILKRLLMKSFLGITLLVLLLNGCGTKWYHPTKTETQFYADSSSCMSKSAQAFPQNIKKNNFFASKIALTHFYNERHYIRLRCCRCFFSVSLFLRAFFLFVNNKERERFSIIQ